MAATTISAMGARGTPICKRPCRSGPAVGRLDRQVGEAQSRFDLGQATRTDVAQLEAQRSSVVANLADAEAGLASARAAYRAVVGQNPGDLEAEVPPPAMLPADLADARASAELANPRLLERIRIVDASEARIDQARAQGAPSVDLIGAYGRGVRETGGALRAYDNAASVGLTLRVPLLNGGLVASQVREAQATTRADRYAAQAELRETIRAVETAWATLQAAGQRETASRDGLLAAQIALDGVRAEYEFGLRSTIDILLAEQSYRSAQLALARARSDVLIAQAALLRATGRLDRGARRCAGGGARGLGSGRLPGARGSARRQGGGRARGLERHRKPDARLDRDAFPVR